MQLEEKLEGDRLNEELNLLHHDRPSSGELFRLGNTQILSLPASGDQPAEAIHGDTEHIPTQTVDPNDQDPPVLVDVPCQQPQHFNNQTVFS